LSNRLTPLFTIQFIVFFSLFITLFHFFLTEEQEGNESYEKLILNSLKNGEGLFIVKTNTKPSFLQVLPNPYKDKRNTEHLIKFGTLHPRFTSLLRKLFQEGCSGGKLFVDCGANYGYFSLYAASFGCRSIISEPNPYLIPVIHRSIELNHFSELIKVFPKIITNDERKNMKLILYPEHWGLSFVDNSNNIQNSIGEVIDVETIQINNMVKENVFILKIDVEGHELSALHSAKKLFDNYQVKNIFLEWDKVKGSSEAKQVLHWLHSQYGFEVFGLPYETYDEQVVDWESPVWLNEVEYVHPNNYSTQSFDNLWLKLVQ